MAYIKVPFSPSGEIPSDDEVRKVVALELEQKQFSISTDYGYPCIAFLGSASSEVVEKVFQRLESEGFKVY